MNENQGGVIEYRVGLESSKDNIVLKIVNNSIVKDANFEIINNYIGESDEITVLDIGNNEYRLFRDLKNAKNHFKS